MHVTHEEAKAIKRSELHLLPSQCSVNVASNGFLGIIPIRFIELWNTANVS